jgi:DNA-binding transcriptional regulator YiaG
MPKRKAVRNTAGARIIAALSGLAESLEAGAEVGTVRTVELPDEPGEYAAAAVRETRAMLKASQAVFARLLGVSTILVRSWESGARAPSRLARRLLDEIHRDPARWAAMAHRPKRPAPTQSGRRAAPNRSRHAPTSRRRPKVAAA